MKAPFEEIRITDLDVNLTQPSQEAHAFRRLCLKSECAATKNAEILQQLRERAEVRKQLEELRAKLKFD